MSQEIVEAVRDIEREKGIESGTLVAALEDALLAAYKKMPGAARHAIVEIDEQGDFRVFAVELPADIEERLIEEARERKLEELEALEVETGERSHTLISDDDLAAQPVSLSGTERDAATHGGAKMVGLADRSLETRRRDVDGVFPEVIPQHVGDALAERMVDTLNVVHEHREPLRASELDRENLCAWDRALDLRCYLPRQLLLLVVCRCHCPCSCHKKWARRPTSRTARNVVWAE